MPFELGDGPDRTALWDDRTQSGPAWCRAHAGLVDAWLAELFDRAVDGARGDRFALLAVGGYGRCELAPFSDIDVWLLHDGSKAARQVSERLWYPVWDAGFKLGHGVATPKELLRLVESDLDTATTVLSCRPIAGDAGLGASMAEAGLSRWRSRAKRWLDELCRRSQARWHQAGEVAFLLEPDLKDGRGGLRDVHTIRWVQAAGSPQLPVDESALAAAHDLLLQVRVALHLTTGRPGNVLRLQDQAAVASALGHHDPEELMVAVTGAARTIAWEADDVIRRVTSALRGPAAGGQHGERRIGPGVVARDGEIHVTSMPSDDELLVVALRAAAAAATTGTSVDRQSLTRLASSSAAKLPEPWPAEARSALVELLSAGSGAVGVIESLDQVRLWERLIPEWSHVRNRSQRNPYHTFTVDRHLVEAAVLAAALADTVERPDLLVLGALMHDLGKGFPGDHSAVGAALARGIAQRLGFPPDDAETLVFLVEHHLLLAEVATRRDIDDPHTIERVAATVVTSERLLLLAALTEADAVATGPTAWGTWKAGLVKELVARTHERLGARASIAAPPADIFPSCAMQASMRNRATEVSAHGCTLDVVAADRPGLFSRCAGVLALHGLDVSRARAHSAEGMAAAEFVVHPIAGRPVVWDSVLADVERALARRLALRARLADRVDLYGRRSHRVEHLGRTGIDVRFDNESSLDATVIDIRAPDAIGLLYRITEAFEDLDLDIRSARVNTLGTHVVDAFYVIDSSGQKLADRPFMAEVERAVRHAAASG